MAASNSKDPLLEFYLADYKHKVDYLNGHFTRLWNRFNYFVSIEAAIFGSGALSGAFQDQTNLAPKTIYIVALGAVTSLFWYVFGAQDRYLVELYRKQIEATVKQIKAALQLPPDYYYVGQTGDIAAPKIPARPYQWRSKPFSTTKLAAWFPLAVFLAWLAALLYMLARSL